MRYVDRTRRRLIPLAALAALVATPVAADWVASGTFRYRDRQWDHNGFTGTVVEKPMRFVDVEVVDPGRRGKKSILAQGTTDADGRFSLAISDSSKRTVYVRALTQSRNTPDLWVEVTTHGGEVYALASAEVGNHNPNINVNFGVMVAGVGTGGEAFNMYDLLVHGADFIAYLEGARPGRQEDVKIQWEINGGVTGAAYTVWDTIVMRDYAAYDDTVVLHEWSHYAMNHYGSSSNTGGGHFLSDCNQDPRLSFDEGRASAMGCAVRRFFGMPFANVYMRTSGAAGPGGVQNWFDLEDETQYACDGSASEVSVARALWDISDSASTTDMTPGTEDAPDSLALPDLECWEVYTGPMVGQSGITMDTFWDGWFGVPVSNNHLAAMRSIFGFLGMEYDVDAMEPNNTASEAAPIVPNGSPVHLTFFWDDDGSGAGENDVDYLRFAATPGVTYTAETLNLLSGADTFLEILDTDGSSVLASNDDRAAGDPSSRVAWTAPREDTFYLRIQHVGYGKYGSYDLGLTHP